MADRRRRYPFDKKPTTAASYFLQTLREHAPHSPKLTGFAALVISGGILLLLNGLTLTATVLGLVFLIPLIIISSPVWIPVVLMFFTAVAGLLSFSGFSVAAFACLRWLYRRFMASPTPTTGDGVGNMGSRVRDAAPGAYS